MFFKSRQYISTQHKDADMTFFSWSLGYWDFPLTHSVAALKDNSWDALLPLIIPGAEAVSTWILTLISIIFLFKLHWRPCILNYIFIVFQSRNANCVLIARRATATEPAEALKQYGPWCYSVFRKEHQVQPCCKASELSLQVFVFVLYLQNPKNIPTSK